MIRFLIFMCFVLKTQAVKTLNDEKFTQCNAVTTRADFLQEPKAFKTHETLLTLTGATNLNSTKNNQFKIQTNLNISRYSITNCPSLQFTDVYIPTELITALTAPCRYDRLQRPLAEFVNGSDAVKIYIRTFIYGMQSFETSKRQFTMQLMLEFRYKDARLAYSKYAPKRLQPIQGGSKVNDLIWLPHLFLANVQQTSILGAFKKDFITSIASDGTVVFAVSIQTTLICTTKFKNFPFDEQFCTTNIESWLYNCSDLKLYWEQQTPLVLSRNFQIPGYTLANTYYNTSIIRNGESVISHGEFIVDYCSISFTLHLLHHAGYYIMDYFIPSIIIVAASWVSFWIRADQTPARTILSCHTMLSLITLSANQLKEASGFDTVFEAWFLGCVLFIFGCLVEFAFSNTILRRKRNVELKEFSGKSILKKTFVPRKLLHRRSIYEGFEKFDSVSSLTDSPVVMTSCVRFNTDLMETSFSTSSLTTIIDKCVEEHCNPTEKKRTFASMTPEEVSIWLDRKARFVFPVAFLLFNIIFWLFVLIL